MKQYVLDVELLVSKKCYITAESKEEAEDIFNEEVKKRPHNLLHNFTSIIDANIRGDIKEMSL